MVEQADDGLAGLQASVKLRGFGFVKGEDHDRRFIALSDQLCNQADLLLPVVVIEECFEAASERGYSSAQVAEELFDLGSEEGDDDAQDVLQRPEVGDKRALARFFHDKTLLPQRLQHFFYGFTGDPVAPDHFMG